MIGFEKRDNALDVLLIFFIFFLYRILNSEVLKAIFLFFFYRAPINHAMSGLSQLSWKLSSFVAEANAGVGCRAGVNACA